MQLDLACWVANTQPQAKMSQSLVKRGTPSRPTDEYTPFISKVTVSTPGVVGTQTPIAVLRDTGASQSLLLKVTSGSQHLYWFRCPFTGG